jgi:hypothetical protein
MVVRLFILSLLALSAETFAQTASQTRDLTPEEMRTTALHQMAYRNFGASYYRPYVSYPSTKIDYAYRHLANHALSFKSGIKVPLADETGWEAVPVNSKVVYYRTQYHLKDLVRFDLQKILTAAQESYTRRGRKTWDPNHYPESNAEAVKIKAEDRASFERAKIHMVLFSAEDFVVKYYPGSQLLKKVGGKVNTPNLPGNQTRGNVPWRSDMDRVSSSDSRRLVGVFKGTFDNLDSPLVDRLPGLKVDGRVVDSPTDKLQTIGFTAQGQVQMGRWQNIKNREQDFVAFRQNEYPLIENGQIVEEGAFPMNWNRFSDDIIRTYLVSDKGGEHFGYVWAVYAHPSMVAEALKDQGFTEVSLLDIHPSVGSAFIEPNALRPNATTGKVKTFFDGGAYYFVPEEDQLFDTTQKILSAFARVRRGEPMQWPFQWAQSGSASDFIGVFVKE